ncbi:papain-like cysteine protease family protein [Streptomyces sp. BE20]|uniref:papain-like cysteine protease family protein n=1 Tax=Streptomycetaceae TaxID=2062 RepID=UPI002E7A597E|nr:MULTISPECIES: papain-like cysteine protease family protein [unclassified Streptomyces]MED7949101.1 papain-like cysteine protease family protein [Streptomyces sp. BE303]MEE1825851.1 papain-like cysteine protease family protein [Streptomyces sp. BE20]
MSRFRFAATGPALALAASGILLAAGGTARAEAGYDQITMLKQEKSQWCWSAAGLTIAKFQGFGTTQADFCDRASQYSGGPSCNNQPATLGDMANAWSSLGLSKTGTGISSAASFAQVTTDVKAARPIGARIGWTSGGGHMNIVYGFDTSNNTIAVADPWPDTATYTWWNYGDYVNNSSFKWTHSRTGISR